ncbi:hypothetical protein AARAC_002903, partial [Aspergillus arachidicola]
LAPITSYSRFESPDFRYLSPQVYHGKADIFGIGNSVTVPCTVPTVEGGGGGVVRPYGQGLMAQSAQVGATMAFITSPSKTTHNDFWFGFSLLLAVGELRTSQLN